MVSRCDREQWHTDLLRGRYVRFLDNGVACNELVGGCIKVPVCFQDGANLGIAAGSHRSVSPLDDTQLENAAPSKPGVQLQVKAGDVVMMDIRALHRGATDDKMSRPELADTPKILLSTVFGAIGSAFAQAMQSGNAHRMADWDRHHLNPRQHADSGNEIEATKHPMRPTRTDRA